MPAAAERKSTIFSPVKSAGSDITSSHLPLAILLPKVYIFYILKQFIYNLFLSCLFISAIVYNVYFLLACILHNL